MYFIDIENIDVHVLYIKPESWTVEEERETQLRDGVEVCLLTSRQWYWLFFKVFDNTFPLNSHWVIINITFLSE